MYTRYDVPEDDVKAFSIDPKKLEDEYVDKTALIYLLLPKDIRHESLSCWLEEVLKRPSNVSSMSSSNW